MAQSEKQPVITMKNCYVTDGRTVFLSNLNWTVNSDENWIVTGSNGGGKSALASALSGSLEIIPEKAADGKNVALYFNLCKDSTISVSFEAAAKLIEEEKLNDESEFIEGGVDIGRTPRELISAVLPIDKKNEPLEDNKFVKAFNTVSVLDRGLKYLSTGEIRRTLLVRALVAEPDLLVLDEPFEGLDTESRKSLRTFLQDKTKSRILLMMDRFDTVPGTFTNVLELSKGKISFCGKKEEYERINAERLEKEKRTFEKNLEILKNAVKAAQAEGIVQQPESLKEKIPVLIEMKNVVVQWDNKRVLDNLSWKVNNGEHWLIRGPNGSGKTTLLELITGDNSQVFCNDVSLFGKKRGTGETIWELKEKMGIVSYRLHVDYRNFGGMSAENIVISGLHDSVGLYTKTGDYEKILAGSWLDLCGFEGRHEEKFGNLSYGEQRAVLIARAVVKCPPLLILDEPCHGLDTASKKRILAVLRNIAESGITTLLHVTHDPDEVLDCEKHIMELHPGENPMYQILVQNQ